jgi:hypothetical protein
MTLTLSSSARQASETSRDRSSSAPRPPFVTSATTTPPKIRRSTGHQSLQRRTEYGKTIPRPNQPQRSLKKSQISFLEKAREEGRSAGELELIETIEREIVQGKVNVSWDSIGLLSLSSLLLSSLLPNINRQVVSNKRKIFSRRLWSFLNCFLITSKAFVGLGKVFLCLAPLERVYLSAFLLHSLLTDDREDNARQSCRLRMLMYFFECFSFNSWEQMERGV